MPKLAHSITQCHDQVPPRTERQLISINDPPSLLATERALLHPFGLRAGKQAQNSLFARHFFDYNWFRLLKKIREKNMNVAKETTNNPLDVRIILAILWAAGMLSSLNGDTYRLNDPDALKSLLDNTASVKATPELLLIMSMVFVVPILMSVLTLIMKPTVSRLANRILGTLYALIILTFWVMALVIQSTGYGVVWATAQAVFASLIVWYAWKWPKQQS